MTENNKDKQSNTSQKHKDSNDLRGGNLRANLMRRKSQKRAQTEQKDAE
jgi:hypothetical protein